MANTFLHQCASEAARCGSGGRTAGLDRSAWRRSLLVAVCAAGAMADGAVAHAQWIQTGAGPYAYTGTANWNAGVINNNFSGFTLSAAANPQVITFSTSYNLGSSITFAYDAGSANDLRFQGSGGTQTVSFGGLWTVNLTNSGASNDQTYIAFGSPGANNLTLSLTAPTTFDTNVTYSDRRGLGFQGDVSGTHAITKTGSGALGFYAAASYAGNLAAREGTVVLAAAGTMQSVSRVSLGGSVDPTRSGLLLLENRVVDLSSGNAQGISNRLNDAALIAGLGNGQLGLIGSGTTSVAETTGTFANQAGFNRMYVLLAGNTNAASQATTLTLSDLARPAGSTLGMQGGWRPNMIVPLNLGQGTGTASPQILATLINGSAASQANVNGIVPWAFVGGNTAPSAFATYGANGFKPYGLDSTGTINDNGGTEVYVTTIASGSATSNVRMSGANQAVSGTATINSLTINLGSVTRSVATDTLKLTSGGLMTTTTGSISIAPRVDVNGREGIVFAGGRLSLSGGIVNDGGNGVTFMATGTSVGGGVFLDGTSTYTGATRINYGDVAVRVAGGIPQTSDVRVDVGGSLNLWDGLAGGTVIGALSGLGRVTARNSGGVTSVLVTGSGNGSGDFGGTITNGTSGVIALTKIGTGTQTLSGSNTYTGQTRVSAGALVLGSTTAISSQSNLLVDGGVVDLGGFTNTVGTVTLTSGSIRGSGVLAGSSYALQGGGVSGQLGTGAITVSTGTTTLGSAGRLNAASGLTITSGQLTLGGNETVASFVLTGGSLAGTGQTLTSGSAYDLQAGGVAANLGGAVGLVKSTAGTVVLSGSNTYTGPTTIAGGRLAVSNAGSLASASPVALTAAGAAFDISGISPTGITIGTFSGSAGSVVTLGSKNLLVNSTAAAIFAGAIEGTGGLSKQGAAALTLSGTSSYTGATSIDAGQLFVNGQLGNTALTVNSGGFLGGSGSVLGSVAVLAGGTFSPGNSPGLFTADTMALSGVTLMEIDALGVRGIDYDAVTATNALTYGGTMEIDFAFLAAVPDSTSFNLFAFGSQSGFFTGITTKNDGSFYGGLSFSGSGDVWTASQGAQTLSFTHSTGVLVIVPEPAGWVIAGIGVIAAAFGAARRGRTAIMNSSTSAQRASGGLLFVLLAAGNLSAAVAAPLLLSPVGIPVRGDHFHCDAGLTVMDWNRDGLPDLLLHDTGSIGTVTIHLNEGTRTEPRYGHGIWLPYNSTETAPTTIEHVMARTFCDLNHDSRPDMILYEGRLRYLPDIGTPLAPYWWTMWPNKPWFFPGTPRMCEENTRFPAGPESMFWNKGVFPRQVLTLTAADWDGDGLEDVIVCRFTQEAPGLAPVHPGDTGEKWNPWMTAKIPAGVAPARPPRSWGPTKPPAPLTAAPERETVFYRNVGTRAEPRFDAGLTLRDSAGAAIVAPNPTVIDLDGDGRLDLVGCETPIHRNAFRVDWPTEPHVVWFRRTGEAADRLEPTAPVRDAEGTPIAAGVAAVFHDMRGAGVRDLLVLDGDRGSVRWHRNLAASAREPARFGPATLLRGSGFPRFERSYQPVIVDWFGTESRDLILYGETDLHCKFALRRAALLRNTTAQDGPCSFRLEGFFTYRGNKDLVPVTEEDHQYDRYRSALAVVPGEPRRILASAGSRLFLFDQLADDGLTFQRMRPIPLPGETNRVRGWQDITIDQPQVVKQVRISNDANGMGNFNDGHLHLLRLELIAGGRNMAQPDAIESVTGTRDDAAKKPQVQRPMNMFQPDNANTDTELKATTFGFFRGAVVVTLKEPAALDRIRFLLSNRQSQWYNQIASFLWQGQLLRAGFEEDEIFYHYKVEVSADGKAWTVVGDRTRNDRISVFPQALDWDGDGRWDLLLGTTVAFCNWPQAKNFSLLRNVGTNDDPKFSEAIPLADEAGEPLSVRAHWYDQFAMHCGVKAVDLDGDGRRDLVIEGFTPKSELLYLRNVSPDPLTPRFTKPVAVPTAAGSKLEFTGRYRYFDVADMDGDGLSDVVNCDAGMPVIFSGLSTAAPARIDDLRAATATEGGLLVRWSVPAGRPARWEIRWSQRPEIGEQEWATLPGSSGTYAAGGARTQEAVLSGLDGPAAHIAVRSFTADGAASAVSQSVPVAAPPARLVILRNGPADGECRPEYTGCTAATIDAANESKPFDGRDGFTARTCTAAWGAQPKKDTKLALVRFERLPTHPARRAVLRLCVNHAPLALAGIMEDRISVNLLPPGSWESGATWLDTGLGKPWEGDHTTRGAFVSFAAPRRSIEPQPWIEWDVTEAVNAAAATPAATIDLLVRSEYIGHYTSLVGHTFFGTESKDVNRRPQLMLEYEH